VAGHFLTYNEADGTFTRRNSSYAGLVTKGINRGKKGRKIEVKNIAYAAHKVAFLLHEGHWPDTPIYHVNGNSKDNRWLNLTLDKTATEAHAFRQSRLRFTREQRQLKLVTVDEIAVETWKPVTYAPGYFASDLGRFKSRKGLMNGTLNHTGYQHIGMMVNGKQCQWLAHRVIAGTFMESNGLKIVNHKDGNKANNRLVNLEWCNHSHNTKHWQAMRANPNGKRFKRIINDLVMRNTL